MNVKTRLPRGAVEALHTIATETGAGGATEAARLLLRQRLGLTEAPYGYAQLAHSLANDVADTASTIVINGALLAAVQTAAEPGELLSATVRRLLHEAVT